MTDISPITQFETALREEWVGPHTTATGDYFVAPEIREGGTTDTFVRLAVEIAERIFAPITLAPAQQGTLEELQNALDEDVVDENQGAGAVLKPSEAEEVAA